MPRLFVGAVSTSRSAAMDPLETVGRRVDQQAVLENQSGCHFAGVASLWACSNTPHALNPPPREDLSEVHVLVGGHDDDEAVARRRQ